MTPVCTPVPYKDEKSAKRSMAQSRRRRDATRRGSLRQEVWACAICGAWHASEDVRRGKRST